MALSTSLPRPDTFKQAHPPVLPVLPKDVPGLARVYAKQQARRYFQAFCETYLPHHFSKGWGEHHSDLIKIIQDDRQNKRIARCEPREHGKSTLVLVGAPLWWLAKRNKWYIALFGAGGGQFWNHYSALQQELDLNLGNDRLLTDFPHLAPMMDFKHQFVAWNDSKSKVRSGAVIEALTMGSRVRGMKEGKMRPDVMIFDDPQDDDTVSTDYQRNKFMARFRTTLLNLIGPGGDIYVIGNLLHNDSMIGQLMRDPSWDSKLYRAENIPIEERDKMWPIGNTKQDGTALWPDAWPLTRLYKRREEIKNRAYAIEFMNRMVSEEEQVYDSTQFMKFHFGDFDLDDTYDIVGWWDPSNPKERRYEDADYASITIAATKRVTIADEVPTRYWWVFHNWLWQARAELQVEEALRCVKEWPVKRLYYEDNGGFGMIRPYLKKVAEERGIGLPVKMLPTTKNKIQKIYNAEATVKKRVFFADHLSTQFFTQWDEFPHGGHDDGPDSVVSLIEAYERTQRAFAF